MTICPPEDSEPWSIRLGPGTAGPYYWGLAHHTSPEVKLLSSAWVSLNSVTRVCQQWLTLRLAGHCW